MAFAPGDKLGPYEIVEAIGKGGMGEVFRARDRRLNRDVAIKTSAQHFSERFEREARAIAALNHPNICTLFDVGSAPDVPSYLVMELVEGPTLADRIKEGPIAAEEAEAIAMQIAQALEAAHEKAITHRDLKPANVKLRPDGSVKVLDFGLAKVGHTPTVEASNNSPTITIGMTEAGMILGTAAYMAPEQAKGRQVDHRADIWAFGVVLYEMLTGKRLFDGDDLTEVLASVVKDQPDLTAVPTRFRKLLEACLQKDPRKRLQSIGDAKLLLTDDVVSLPPAPQKSVSWLPWAVAGLLAAGLILTLWAPWRAASSPGQEMNVVLESAAQTAWLSPDGTRLLEVGATSRVLTLSTGEYRELPGIQRMFAPFWSPDGRWIAYSYNSNLMVTPASGGPVQEICQDTGNFFGGSWHSNGTVLIANVSAPIRAVKVVNGAAVGGCEAVLPDSGNNQWNPEWLPDGEHFLYTVPEESATDISSVGVYFAKLQDTAPRRILPDASSVRYAPPAPGEDVGHILFLRGGRLMAQPFRAEDGSLQGDPIELATDVATEFTRFYGVLSIGSNGLLAYSTGSNRSQLTWLDRQGREIRRTGTPKSYAGLSLSPDDSTIGVAGPSGTASSTMRVADGVETQFDVTRSLVWSPDGAWIAAFKEQQGLVRFPAGGGPPETLLANQNASRPSQWTSHGILYQEEGDVWILSHPETPGSQPEKVLETPAQETQAQLSPNGQWLAFTMIESGPMDVYVCHFPDCTNRQKLAGNREPRWSADGKELFWLRDVGGESQLVAATVHLGATFTYDSPHVLFSLKTDWFTPELNLYTYAPSRDGQQFLVMPYAEDATRRLHLVTNWRRLLKNGVQE